MLKTSKRHNIMSLSYYITNLGDIMDNTMNVRNNPSRKVCEETIRRILITEILKNGANTHFKKATDFMDYFESLYPASDALTKQVQRAVKALNMPKDEQGYFVPDKTTDQMEEDKEISKLLQKNSSNIATMENINLLHIEVDDSVKSYLVSLIAKSNTFKGKYFSVLETGSGILFMGQDLSSVQRILENMLSQNL